MEFAVVMRNLITAYANNAFEIDPRDIPATDKTREGRAVYPTPEGWLRAAKRARIEHDISASAMTECIVSRYSKRQIRVRRAIPCVACGTHIPEKEVLAQPAVVEVVEVQRIRRNLLTPTGQDNDRNRKNIDSGKKEDRAPGSNSEES